MNTQGPRFHESHVSPFLLSSIIIPMDNLVQIAISQALCYTGWNLGKSERGSLNSGCDKAQCWVMEGNKEGDEEMEWSRDKY